MDNSATNKLAGFSIHYYSTNNFLTGNNATNNYYGYDITFSANNTLISNNATNNDRGFKLVESANNSLTGNTADDNEYGIFLDHSDYNTVCGNFLSAYEKCIYEVECTGNIIFDNICEDLDDGSNASISSYNMVFLIIVITVFIVIFFKKTKH